MRTRNKINDAAASVAMAVVVIATCVTWQSEQLWPAAHAAVVVDDEEVAAADLVAERFPTEEEQLKLFLPKPVIEVRTVPQFDGRDGFERALLAINNEDEPELHLASLPPMILDPPKAAAVKPRAPKPEVWAATLDERQSIARNYLAWVCPKILRLEGMQSAATIAKTNARFMRAKNPAQVIGGVKFELREHPNVVWSMCPAEFYNKLFAQK